MFDLPAASVTGPDTVAKARVIWNNGLLMAFAPDRTMIWQVETSEPKGRFVIGPWTTDQGHKISRKCYACSKGFRRLNDIPAEELINGKEDR